MRAVIAIRAAFLCWELTGAAALSPAPLTRGEIRRPIIRAGSRLGRLSGPDDATPRRPGARCGVRPSPAWEATGQRAGAVAGVLEGGSPPPLLRALTAERETLQRRGSAFGLSLADGTLRAQTDTRTHVRFRPAYLVARIP